MAENSIAAPWIGFHIARSNEFISIGDESFAGVLANEISVQIEAAAIAPDDGGPLASIDWGSELAARTVDVFFAPAGVFVDGAPSNGWSPYEIKQAMLALEQIENVSNLSFQRTFSQVGAEFRLITLDLGDPLFLGLMFPPDTEFAGNAAFNPEGVGWENKAIGVGALEQGGLGFTTLLHEFGHGVGLAQPHDDGGTSTIMEGVTEPFGSFGVGDLNQGVFTVMSYNTGWETGPEGLPPEFPSTYGLEGTVMALDIAVIQEKYGANSSFAKGDDVYILPNENELGNFYSCIWDAGGVDEIRSKSALGAMIDLRPATLKQDEGGGGFVSFESGIRAGFTIAHGVKIENATGGSANDSIVGNAGENRLAGCGGDDSLIGRGGADLLLGGSGKDELRGGPGADVLDGGPGADLIDGGAGADEMDGRLGNDQFLVDDVGDVVKDSGGIDTVIASVSFNLPSVIENLKLTIDAGDVNGNGNGLANLLTGSDGANVIKGGGGDDEIVGLAGDDILNGQSGDDILRGGDGFDFLTGKLGNDRLFGGDGNDQLRGEEGHDYMEGGGAKDRMIGKAGRDTLLGQEANDKLFGNGGQDTIIGGVGKDSMTGGADADVFILAPGCQVDTIKDFEVGLDKLDLSAFGFAGFAEVADLTREKNGRAQINLDGSNDVLRLNGVLEADLSDADFIF